MQQICVPNVLEKKVILACKSITCCLVVFRIYVALVVFQPYRDLEAGDNQSLKFKWRGGELNPRPLAPKAKSLTTRPPPLLKSIFLVMQFT